MKKLFLFIMILTIDTYIYSQSLRLGIVGNFLTGNKYLNYEIGPALIADYSIKNLPISFQGIGRFYLSELSDENKFSTGYTYTVFSLGASIIYYPVIWAIKPYIGLGVFYNSNNIQQSGTPFPFNDGTIHTPSYLENNFSTEITGGINFSANSPINFIVEITKTFNKPFYELIIFDTNGEKVNKITKKEKFNFNSLFVKLGLFFRI